MNIKLIIKGFLIGLGKIIPGVSGSLIALNLGIYYKLIAIVNHPFKNIKNNINFLFPILLGIFFSIIIGSKLLLFFFNKYYIKMIFLFLGFLIGSINIKEHKFSKKEYFFILIFFITILFLFNIKSYESYSFNNRFIDYIYIFLLGIIDALSMVIPGISGTAIFISMGCYEFILLVFSHPFNNISISITLIVGIFIGIIITSKIIEYLSKRDNKFFLILVYACIYSSLYFLFKEGFSGNNNIKNITINILLLIIGYIISIKFKNKI